MRVLLSYCGDPVPSFAELIRRFPLDSFGSPNRSTLLLLDYWRDPHATASRFLSLFGHGPCDLELHFEYQVAVAKGRGKPSFTDLMIVHPHCAIALEAKYTEPRYESVREWLSLTPSANRTAVLEGWFSAIAQKIGKQPDEVLCRDLPYQLIHRTASACTLQREETWVVYHVFGKAATHYADDLIAIASALRTTQIRFALLSTPVMPTAAHDYVWLAWGRSHAQRGDIRAALLAGPLFAFAETRITFCSPAA
jgi:hypothetical protein